MKQKTKLLNTDIAILLGKLVRKQFGYLPPNFGLTLAKAVADYESSREPACSIPIFDVGESPLVYGDAERFSVYPYAEDGFIALVPLVGGWFVEHCVISDTGQLESSDGQDWGYSVFDVSHWMPLSKLPERN